uniref:BEACH domain-containing protein n=1 Tax=Biomphalaria glabrata TaxID=6526 RepID=A0A2C9KF32_BIOGL
MAFLETDTLGQERFSLLLLDPGEIYFEDFSVFYYPAGLSKQQSLNRQQRGHLKLCSKSIVFVPQEILFPILKFPLKYVKNIDEWSGGLFTKLEDIYEKIILETQGDRITPLVTNPGRIMLTSSRLYFQPFCNIDKWPVLKLRIKDIKRLICRRFLLRQLGLEIFCRDTAPISHLFMAFKTEKARNQLYESILHLSAPLNCVGCEWGASQGADRPLVFGHEVVNYLHLADRSFNDLAQYPVMPWVIQDYSSSKLDLDDEDTYRDLSKPIGALNKERLDRIKERLPDLPEPKFLYGSHYSTPGYVLFYLARIAYIKPVTFGFRNDGRPVGDVELPPWASSPAELVTVLRKALESDVVSRNIHHWIDLVFGYQQRGEEAWKADNVFYYLTYEGAIDLDSIQDASERRSLETQIMEFGQTPKQLFKGPHPQRFKSQSIPSYILESSLPQLTAVQSSSPPAKDIDLTFDTADSVDNISAMGSSSSLDLTKLTCHLQYALHKDAVAEVRLSPDGLSIFSVSQDSFLKMYSLEDQRQLRSVNMSLMALSSCEVMEDNKTIVVGCWDNKVYFYSIEYGRVLDTLNGHDDAVSCVKWKSGKLFTASWDSTVKVWEMNFAEAQNGGLPCPEYLGQLDHDEGVTCLDIDDEGSMMITGTKGGHLALWDLSHYYILAIVSAHSGPMNACLMSQDKRCVYTCGTDSLLKVFDMETVTEICAKDLQYSICCMRLVGATSILVGDSGGQLCLWDMDKGQLTQTLPAHSGAVTCLDLSKGTLLTGGSDKTVKLWKQQ